MKDAAVSPARERGAEQTSVEPTRLWMLGYQEQMDQSSLTKSVQMLRCHTRALRRAVATCCRRTQARALLLLMQSLRQHRAEPPLLCISFAYSYGNNCVWLP